MSALADIANIISDINQRGDAQDIANKIASNDSSIQDAPGAPIGSGIQAAWASQHPTVPLPSGLASVAGNRQSAAVQQVAQDAISGNIDAPTALQKVSQYTGGDPTKIIGMVSQLRAYGLMPQASQQQPNPAPQQASNLAAMGNVQPTQITPMMGSQGDTAPNTPAPSNVNGSMSN